MRLIRLSVSNRYLLLFPLLSICWTLQSAGQARPSTSGSFALPPTTGILGRQDEGALAEVAAYLAATGPGKWVGMQGVGKITYADQMDTVYDATLSNLGDSQFRLDSQTKTGPTSVRINGSLGKTRRADGTMSVIPVDTARFGLFSFELPRAQNFLRESISLIDQGLVMVEQTSLHRITYEFSASGMNPETKRRNTTAIDLYFDPASHLLVKSSTYSFLPDARKALFLSVITYSDYRLVGTALIPFHFAQTLEGEPCLSIQLSDVHINSSIDRTYFEF